LSASRLFRSALVAGALLLPVSGVQAQAIDLATPEGVLTANRKIHCHLEDGKPALYYWQGDVFSRRQGEADKRLFQVQGMNIRACTTVNDPQKGKGFKLVSREILLYLDPNTGEVLRKWSNPWTGKEVEVMHVANDPVNSTWMPTGRDGKPVTWSGYEIEDTVFIGAEVPLFYTNPLAGEYQAQVGGTYHATEMFNFMANKKRLLDPKVKGLDDVHVGWVRMSQWLPWMEMGGREGLLYFHTAGRRVSDWSDMPETLRKEIEANYPIYKAPPPADDARPNETSWTYYKKRMEEKKAAGGAAAPKPAGH